MIATDAFDTYTSLTGATIDNNVGLLSISSEGFSNLQSLFFNIGGSVFEFTPNAQLWPRALNTAIGGASNDIFLIVGDVRPRFPLSGHSDTEDSILAGFEQRRRFRLCQRHGVPGALLLRL